MVSGHVQRELMTYSCSFSRYGNPICTLKEQEGQDLTIRYELHQIARTYDSGDCQIISKIERELSDPINQIILNLFRRKHRTTQIIEAPQIPP